MIDEAEIAYSSAHWTESAQKAVTRLLAIIDVGKLNMKPTFPQHTAHIC